MLFSFFILLYNHAMENANRVSVKCVVSDGAVPPQYKTAGAAGADICAFLSEPVIIKKGWRAMIPTGLFFSIPQGYEVQVRPRSGLAAKNGITVLNSPGTIDSDYRGEYMVPIHNDTDDPRYIHAGDRIAQMIVLPCQSLIFEEVAELSVTDRGDGGFGHTGVK